MRGRGCPGAEDGPDGPLLAHGRNVARGAGPGLTDGAVPGRTAFPAQQGTPRRATTTFPSTRRPGGHTRHPHTHSKPWHANRVPRDGPEHGACAFMGCPDMDPHHTFPPQCGQTSHLVSPNNVDEQAKPSPNTGHIHNFREPCMGFDETRQLCKPLLATRARICQMEVTQILHLLGNRIGDTY